MSRCFVETGAGDGTRTRDLLITNQLLYQLSYTGLNKHFSTPARASFAAQRDDRVHAGGSQGRHEGGKRRESTNRADDEDINGGVVGLNAEQ